MTTRRFSGAALRVLRRSAGIPVEQMALAVGRSAYSVHEYERGRVLPPTDVLVAMADVLEVPVDAFLVPDIEAAA